VDLLLANRRCLNRELRRGEAHARTYSYVDVFRWRSTDAKNILSSPTPRRRMSIWVQNRLCGEQQGQRPTTDKFIEVEKNQALIERCLNQARGNPHPKNKSPGSGVVRAAEEAGVTRLRKACPILKTLIQKTDNKHPSGSCQGGCGWGVVGGVGLQHLRQSEQLDIPKRDCFHSTNGFVIRPSLENSNN